MATAPRKAAPKLPPPSAGMELPRPARTEDRVAKLEQQVAALQKILAQLVAQQAVPAIQQQMADQIAQKLANGETG